MKSLYSKFLACSVLSLLFITLCKSTLMHGAICQLPVCRCQGDLVYEIKCKCDQQNQLIELHDQVLIPTSVKDFQITGCPTVNIYPSGLYDTELYNFQITASTNVTISPSSLHSSRSIRLEDIHHLSLEHGAFSHVEVETILLRNVSTNILEPNAISPSVLSNLSFVNCDFGHGLDQGAISVNNAHSVSFIGCKVGKVEKNAIRITNTARFEMTDSYIDDTEKDAMSIQVEQVVFRRNDFDQLPENWFLSMLKPSVTRDFVFNGNVLRRLETASAFDIDFLPSGSQIDNNTVSCSCRSNIAGLQNLRQNPAAGRFLTGTTCIGSKQRFDHFLQDPKCLNNRAFSLSCTSIIPLIVNLLLHKLLETNQ